jgi:hypothetical protein
MLRLEDFSNLLSNTSVDVDQRKIVSQHQPDIEMNDQCLQGAGIDQEERINYKILRGAGIDQEEGMNDQCLQGAGIDLATKIASSQMEEDNLVLAHPNKFSSLLKLRRSAAWMYRIIKKTQKLTRNVSELTNEEIELKFVGIVTNKVRIARQKYMTWKLQLIQTRKLIRLNL